MKVKVSIVALTLSMAAAAPAQDRSAFVAGSLSAANMQSATDVAVAGTFGYRFNDVVSFAIETTVMPDLRSSFPTGNGSPFSNAGGHVVLFTNGARIDIPSGSSRVTPFFTAGGGVAYVRRTASSVATSPDAAGLYDVTNSSTGLALMLGGGTDFRLTRSLGLEVDLRLFRLFGNDEQNLGRFGLGVRYAF